MEGGGLLPPFPLSCTRHLPYPLMSDRTLKPQTLMPRPLMPRRFVLEFDPEVQQHSADGVKRMRGLCEAALTAVGLHVSEGGRLWAIYRSDPPASLSEGGACGRYTGQIPPPLSPCPLYLAPLTVSPACTSHPSRSPLESLRKFELSLLEEAETGAAAEKQLERIRGLYGRRLQVH